MRFNLDDAGLEHLLSDTEAAAVLTMAATEVASEWERLDPRTKPGGHEPPNINVGAPDRERGVAVVPVSSDDEIWHIIEFGSINNPPYRPATRAVIDVGLKFEDGK